MFEFANGNTSAFEQILKKYKGLVINIAYCYIQNRMAKILGFDPLRKPPPKERFSHFLRSTPNEELQIRRLLLVHHQLVKEEIITGKLAAFL